MNRRALIAAGLAAPLLSACGEGSFSYNYRLKIVARVGDQLHEGSSVVGVVKTVRRNGVCYARCWNGGIRAEAPAVNLGARGYLFGLLGHNGWHYPRELAGNANVYVGHLPIRAIGRRFTAEYTAWQEDEEGAFAALFERVRNVRDEVVLQPEEYPPFVHFRDVDDHTTVEFVDPRDMTRAFGAGVALERCSVQMTEERPRREIESTLPWLADLRRGRGEGALGVRLVPDSAGDGNLYAGVGVRTLTYEHFERGRSFR